MSAFMTWIAGLPALAQIPLVILAFLIVVALILFFVEIAPRRGTRYTVIRLVVCIVAPAVVFLALGSIPIAAIVAAIIGGVFFILDFRARKGSGYLFQLVGFLGPAIILLGVGLIYPTIKTTI
ncbi:MAG: alpha-glucoside transport system permease protein, partial [Microbacteriaceae bacterium]|nr:alpha-glucoside transport system permease protein [Microbacteriaceae bacterium]